VATVGRTGVAATTVVEVVAVTGGTGVTGTPVAAAGATDEVRWTAGFGVVEPW
jgi:hypothetical protein